MEPGDQFNISGKGVWDNYTTTYTDQNTNLGVNVIGTGTIEANQSHSQGKLTFLHGVSVGSGQTVVINGYELYGGQFGTAEVQSPSLYHAATELGFGQLNLDGLHGTSYSFHNDMLSIFNGKSIVDTLRLKVETINGSAPQNFGVSQTATGIVIHTDFYKDGGTLLPVHT
jgi:hypothetical protein